MPCYKFYVEGKIVAVITFDGDTNNELLSLIMREAMSIAMSKGTSLVVDYHISR